MSNVTETEHSPPPRTNGHDQHLAMPATNGGSGGGGGGGGGFTAINGILNRPTSSSITNTIEDSQQDQTPLQPSEVHPLPQQQQTLPPISTVSPPITNGTTLATFVESTRSSPIVNAIYPRRPSSSDSAHSPPRRKRSFPEAFGDRDDDSSTPKKEASPGDNHSRDHYYGDEQRLASEALQRESDESNRRESAMSNGDDRGYLDYERTSAGALIDADRKKRKRVFSNRTKTGCMTCRKRKKKCDEAHPECNNCLRGGFVCEGYSTRNTWQKPNAQKAPVPLQSKEGLSPYQHTPAQPPAQPQPPVRYPDEFSNRPDIKPMEESRRLSPHHESRSSWSGPQHSPYSGGPLPPPGIFADRGIEPRPALPRVESLHDHSESAYSAAQMAQRPPHGPPHGPPPPLQHQPPGHHPLHPPMLGTPQQSNLPPILDAPQQRPGSHHRQESERDKMLRGEYFLPYTPALMADREQCALAVWRFNNSTNPMMGIKLEERMSFFKDIVNLRPSHEPGSLPGPQDPNDPPIVGSVGSGVIVEAPFSCDYGYNITIGNDVVIGADCRITDTCSVHIGNNVVFSPGVRLMCATYAIDPKERKKGKGRALGRQIVIEDDVWIGSNVIILPGVKIGRCTTIGAGSLLHKDVPPYVVVAGNPPKVVRGIYDDGRAS